MVAAVGSIPSIPEVNPRITSPEAKAPEARTPFEKLELKQTAETFQHLKPAGSVFGDVIGVPKYLVSRVIEKIGDMYTDYRLTQAAKEMATFNRETIDSATSANATLATWKQMADKNPTYKASMDALGGPIATIIRAQSATIDPIREKINSALSDIKNISSIESFSSPGAGAALRALSPEDKKKFLSAYDTLRTSLTSLETIALSTCEKAAAFYHTASECFARHDKFYTETAKTLHPKARETYRQEMAAIHKGYVTALTTLAQTSTPSAEAIADAGTSALQKLETQQGQVVELSKAHVAAGAVTERLDQTRKYLSEGVKSEKSLETESNKTFVTVSEKTADALAKYVQQTVQSEEIALANALKSGVLDDITTATEALQKKSEEVHNNLQEAAKVLMKVNAGYDQSKKITTPDQAEQILTLLREKKMDEEEIQAVKGRIETFVAELRDHLEDRITRIFGLDENGDRAVTAQEQSEIKVLAAYADDLLEQVQRMDNPTQDQIAREIKVSRKSLREALSPAHLEEATALAEKAARIKEKVEPAPAKTPWWKFW